MAAQIALGKVICFRCRSIDCVGACPARKAPAKAWLDDEIKRTGAWLGGACLAGTAFGAVIALLCGG